MASVKITVADIVPGMYLVSPGLSWIKAPLLYMEEGLITSREEIAQIIKQGYTEAYHDPSRFRRLDELAKDQEEDIWPDPKGPLVSLDEEIPKAAAIYADSFDHVRSLMQAAQGGAVDVAASQPYVESIVNSLNRNVDALVSLSKLKSSDEYTYTHSVNVTIFAVAYAHHLGLPEEKLHLVGMAGLFHDFGKAFIPQEILNAPRRLTPEEQEVMQSHVVLGYNQLKKADNIPPEVLQAVAQHHEKHNGTGYPYRLSGNKIGIYGRILSVSDNYDALSAKRVYKTPMPANIALAMMYKMRGQAWAPGYVERFIKMMGIYPVGTPVQLSSGEQGIVCRSNPSFPAQPCVIMAFDPTGKSISPIFLDLSKEHGLEIERSLTGVDAEKMDIAALLSQAWQ
ncbi:MAG: Cyclic di-GMP phosphodiesterase [Desulfovibrio sp.]